MIAVSSNPRDKLVARATELGFDSCRIAKATAPRHAAEFRAWLEQGAAGEMQWMERAAEKRCDLQRALPGARSVVAVALNYWQGPQQPPRGAGRIARYAWGDDYHDLMLGKLEELSAFLADLGGTQKCYVDTGPVLERDHAAEAGLGWHGKSTMLIDAKLGT
ncbi:MAG: epoxyqueuosine reductase, partial [Verrucomicrobiota bacterium]